MLNEKPSGMRDTSIADKVILGKEISKSVKCFQKKQTFRVYDPFSVWGKKPVVQEGLNGVVAFTVIG